MEVSERFIGEKEDVGTPEVRNNIAKMCAEIHWSLNKYGEQFFQELGRKTYTTPKSYLDLIGELWQTCSLSDGVNDMEQCTTPNASFVFRENIIRGRGDVLDGGILSWSVGILIAQSVE